MQDVRTNAGALPVGACDDGRCGPFWKLRALRRGPCFRNCPRVRQRGLFWKLPVSNRASFFRNSPREPGRGLFWKLPAANRVSFFRNCPHRRTCGRFRKQEPPYGTLVFQYCPRRPQPCAPPNCAPLSYAGYCSRPAPEPVGKQRLAVGASEASAEPFADWLGAGHKQWTCIRPDLTLL